MRGKKAIKNIVTNMLLQIVSIIYGFVVPKIIISRFGSDVNGLTSSITQFLSYITLLESGFGPVVKSVLYKPIASKNKAKIESILKSSEIFFRTISFIFIIYIIILSFVYPVFVNGEFGYFYTFSLVIILSISTFAEYYFGMTYKLYLQAEQKTYVISSIQIFTYILTILIVIIMANLNSSIHLIKLFTCLAFVFRPILQNYYVKKKYHITINKESKSSNIKQKWDGLAQHIAYVIHTNTDVTILTFFCSLIEVSVYSVYFLVVNGVKKIIQVFINGLSDGFGDMIAKKEYDNLNRKFSIYEILYLSIATIIFTSTMILIVPFVSVYTKGVNDANYIRYTFGYLIVISEYIWAIRQPYNDLVKVSGHFKETRIGAWIECISNIVISIILVSKFGIVGVTIGTIIAMTIRALEFIFHTNKYILFRSLSNSIKKIVLVIFETILIICFCRFLPYLPNVNYLNWCVNAIMVFFISSFITSTLYIKIYLDTPTFSIKPSCEFFYFS